MSDLLAHGTLRVLPSGNRVVFQNEVPVCVACSERQDAANQPPLDESQLRAGLMKEMLDTSARAKNASEAFLLLMKDTPSGLPQPDDAQRIQNASNELSVAPSEMEKAHSRLNLYLSRGRLTDDGKMPAE